MNRVTLAIICVTVVIVLLAILVACARNPKTAAPPTQAPVEDSRPEAAAPPPPPPPSPAPSTAERKSAKSAKKDGDSEDKNYAVVRVFYATDRQPTGSSAPGSFYGGDRANQEALNLGTVDVSIPREHRMGAIERPMIWKLEFRENPEKHVVLLKVTPTPAEQFYADLSNKVQSSPDKDIFVFIHGFDNTFEQAAWRTAQLSYDLGFRGAPIMYSWPSKGKISKYTQDEATIEWTAPHLQNFLETIAARANATTVHLVAHSMGNRALTRALTSIAASKPAVMPLFKQVILAAPDIDVGVFKQLAAIFPPSATRVTLYASSHDKALEASGSIHGYLRAGDSSSICVVPAIDTIDASAVDTSLMGHAYYGDNRSIISDMFYLLQNGAPPDQRFGMHPAKSQEATYWSFKP